MKILRFSPVGTPHLSQPMRTRRSSRLALPLILAAFVLGAALPQAASAAEPPSQAETGLTYSLTPSKTEPYTLCPPGGRMIPECDLIIEPQPVQTASGYAVPGGGPLLEGSGELGGWAPKDLEGAYGTPTTGGEGQTVAIVDAYGDKTAESDLAVYREKYELPECKRENSKKEVTNCFRKVNEKGEEKNYPPTGGLLEEEWGVETSLDMDMVSSACPKCHILLVEASGQDPAETAASVKEASTLGATEISNSYGYPEKDAEVCPKEKGCSEYLEDYKQSGIPVVVSSGDSGYDDEGYAYYGFSGAPNWPAASPNVIAVGGTELEKAKNSRGWSEKVWPSSGSGCSLVESKPSWQTDASCSKRTDNDVASVATHLSIYSTPYVGGWENVGGTSASSPYVAGVMAHSNSHTKSLGAEAFYKAGSAGHLFDTTEGSNGTCSGSYLCTAKTGYDGPTGWGTPNGVISLAPENTALPVASPETPDQAVPETTTKGTWTNEPTSYSYQWQRCNGTGGECANISGATSSTYTPVEADVEHTLVVKVTATNSSGSNSASSKTTNKVKPIGEITEYGLPAGTVPEEGITAGPDGNVWFTDFLPSKIGKITTSGTITEYALPKESYPRGIVTGPDGNLWYADFVTSKIGKITTSGTITEYALPAGSEPWDIAQGPDGKLWYTARGTSKIGKITTSGTITEYALPAESEPLGIAAGPDGNLWFTEWGTNKIGKITTSGTITEYALPAGSKPVGVVTGPDGDVWFTDNSTNKIGKITTSGTITEYALPAGSIPRGIVSGPDGNVWYTDFSSNKIGRITTSGTITEYALKGGAPWGITQGSDKNLWYTYYGSGKIGKITP